MTDAESKAKSRQLAAEDLEDIASLRRDPHFNRYWLRRLAQKREQVRVSFENDPPASCSHEEREIRRRILKAYDELTEMMASDEASARRQK